MNGRVERKEHESLCQLSEYAAPQPYELEEMESGFNLFLLIVTWAVIITGCVWFWSALIRMALHYDRWKWMVQR